MAKTVVNTEKLAAVHGGAHLYSLIADADVENGAICYVGNLDTSIMGQETHKYVAFTADNLNKDHVVLVADPEWSYKGERSAQDLDVYVNKAGVPFRAYDLVRDDVFSITADGIVYSQDSDLAVGSYVTNVAGSAKLNIATKANATQNNFYGIIEAIKTMGVAFTASNGTVYGKQRVLYNIRVLKNA